MLWLLLALVWVPSLGHLHQVAHALPLAHAQAGERATGVQVRAAGAFLPPLLAQHSLADCLLLDQLALAAAMLFAPPVLLPPAPVVAPAPLPERGIAQRHVALFQARGPPPQARG